MRRAAVPAGRAAAGIAHRLPAGWKPASPHLLLWPGKALPCIGPAAPRGGERGVPLPPSFAYLFFWFFFSLYEFLVFKGRQEVHHYLPPSLLRDSLPGTTLTIVRSF